MAADKSRPRTPAGRASGARLASYLQERSDDERAALARELHDDLGGLLVAAKIDLNHMEHDRALDAASLGARVGRVRDSLDAAIALNRRLIEALQPGLLMHIGLCAALRWYVEDTCLRAGRSYTLDLPAEEPALKPEARLALYRIAQDALGRVLGGAGREPIQVALSVRDGVLELSFVGAPARSGAGGDPAVLSIRHRITGLGGTLGNGKAGGGRLSVRLPLANQTL